MSNIDEFGRDLSLRNYQEYYDLMADLKKKYAGMSWAEMTYAAEEEEEEQNNKIYNEHIKKIDDERRRLYIIGEYQLEEGEILE